MIELRELTKRYGDTTAVDRLTCTVRPGHVTGFLGPNGAGKSTTMRMVLGLDAPSAGEALVCGTPYRELPQPMHTVGALLDAGAVHGGRTAFAHLHALAAAGGIGRARVSAVLAEVGLTEVANKRIKGFSLGMRQRLGIANALLGDPGVLLFDEPVNGLDPEGIRWLRELLRGLAEQGRTVLVSSHLMSEMALTADRILIVGRGSLIRDTSVRELGAEFARGTLVRSPEAARLAGALRARGAEVQPEGGDALGVTGVGTPVIADVALRERIPVHELTPRSASLEEAYLRLTDEAVQFRAGGRPGVPLDERPTVEQPATGRSAMERSTTKRPAAKRPAAGESTAEQSTVEQEVVR